MSQTDVLIVMLSSMRDNNYILEAFTKGADDYVTKPFSPSVLMARINKILSKEESEETNLDFGHIHMDMQSRRVFVDQNSIDLTPKEFELLRYLIKNKGIALSRDRILNAVWNYDYYGDLRTVDTHIKQLRAKLGDYAYYISTVRSVGYRLDIENELVTKE
jgi:DNA-binding response OmpR family regulator